jgi:uncharacterized membrane protein
VISNPLLYFLVVLAIASSFYYLDKNHKLKIFKFVPPIVLVYLLSMSLSSFFSPATASVYELNMSYLLPAMLFLILLGVKISDFFVLGKKLIIAYVLAVSSIVFGFIVVAFLFDFTPTMAAAFGSISGSWMGGSANMVAVARALDIPKTAFGYALIVDSVNYTFWIAFLLFLLPFAQKFNSFTKSTQMQELEKKLSKSSRVGKKRYSALFVFSLLVSLCANFFASHFSLINHTTTTVIVATILGIAFSFTKARELNGSSELSSFMLYLLIAFIGSRAVFEDFSGVGLYVFAGFCVLLIHSAVMVVGARVFKLDLFSISVASLANIGGVASASLLAGAYNKALVGVGALMAIMGYIIGTFGGLAVAKTLLWMAG